MRSVVLFLLPTLLLAQMGSPGGGETQAIALHPTQPDIIYAGAAKGLCKSPQAGQDNWPSSGLETYSPRAIVIDPSQPDTVYAGTYEMGVYKTTNAAQTWTAVNTGLTDPHIRALVVDPTQPAILYAGADGGGVFKTTNGGATWTEANHGLIDKVIRALLIHHHRHDVVTVYIQAQIDDRLLHATSSFRMWLWATVSNRSLIHDAANWSWSFHSD